MIYMADVTGYQVGDKTFERGLSVIDARGVKHIEQSYNLAFAEHEATGLPVVALGEDQADKVARLAAAAKAKADAKALKATA